MPILHTAENKEGAFVLNLLVTLNSKYIYCLCVMLRSLQSSNPNTVFDIYVAHSSLTDDDFNEINKNINSNMNIHPIIVDECVFDSAPVLSRISKETYYRLLIESFLPEDVDRILYIDPDTVIINPLDELYNIDFKGNVIAAAPHTYGVVESVNITRLNLKRRSRYVNAGVIMIDVNAWRKFTSTQKLIKFVADNIRKLKLSDQDAINMFFQGKILVLDERRYNLDEKTYSHFKAFRKISMDWVNKNTVIVHFNGRKKPWTEEEYKGKLGVYFEKYR